MKITKYLSKLAEKRTRNVLTIIVMFACASICLGEHTITINSALTPTIDDNGEKVFPFVAGNSNKPDGTVSYANIFPLLINTSCAYSMSISTTFADIVTLSCDNTLEYSIALYAQLLLTL
ncbi:hypothetical protein AGMMS49950_04930 [Endomicrobiia bacterium]|nr:hypothetical protein AGMMS49950_04930 [Endomicrobiia bacterium]